MKKTRPGMKTLLMNPLLKPVKWQIDQHTSTPATTTQHCMDPQQLNISVITSEQNTAPVPLSSTSIVVISATSSQRNISVTSAIPVYSLNTVTTSASSSQYTISTTTPRRMYRYVPAINYSSSETTTTASSWCVVSRPWNRTGPQRHCQQQWVSEWVSSFLTAHQHIKGHSVPYKFWVKATM